MIETPPVRTAPARPLVLPAQKPVLPELPPSRTPEKHSWRQRAALALLIILALVGLFGIANWDPSVSLPRTYVPPRIHMAAKRIPLPTVIDGDLAEHVNGVLAVIEKNINPNTYLAYSFTGDRRLQYWSVSYDNAIRAMAHLRTGQSGLAKKVIDYFIDNTAVHKMGWVMKKGKVVKEPDWIINIVDASEDRTGGRGIEHLAHTGPNAYLGIASAHIYWYTKEQRYLKFARQQWEMLKTLQNEDPKDFNFGGIRMGPMGNPENPREQRLEFKVGNPSFYEFYNGEHAADFKGFSDLMTQIDPANHLRYEHASDLITVWDKKIYDPVKHLFFIGTTEKRYFDPNIAEWVNPGVIPMYPLDTTALKISVYGVDGLETFEKNGAQKIRQALDDKFKVTLQIPEPDGKKIKVTGYDFVGVDDRPHVVRFVEMGAEGDVKVKKGVGRQPLLTDEWSNWVAFADLRLMNDFDAKGMHAKAAKYSNSYYDNALVNGIKTAYDVDGGLAYPYAHPLQYSLNQPVGFGWNTHHVPYALIGGAARILGILRFDPFRVNGGNNSLSLKTTVRALAPEPSADRDKSVLYTEAELYLRDAWRDVRVAQINGPNADKYWERAVEKASLMLSEHKDWSDVAKVQNRAAKRSSEQFPLTGVDNLTVKDLEPVFRKYWALYHVGTAEFILVMSNAGLRDIAREKGDLAAAAT